MTAISPVSSQDDREEAARLMRRYAAATAVDACFATLEAELGDPDTAFHAVLLARSAGHGVGCVALKALDEGRAELVRLYVEPTHRGCGAGAALVEAALDEAGEGGFDRVVLHTLARWQAATALYRRLGFEPAAPYCEVPLDDVLFFERSAKKRKKP